MKQGCSAPKLKNGPRRPVGGREVVFGLGGPNQRWDNIKFWINIKINIFSKKNFNINIDINSFPPKKSRSRSISRSIFFLMPISISRSISPKKQNQYHYRYQYYKILIFISKNQYFKRVFCVSTIFKS